MILRRSCSAFLAIVAAVSSVAHAQDPKALDAAFGTTDVAPAVLTLPEAQGAHGEEVDVPISVNIPNGVGCLQMALLYDAKLLEVVKVDKGPLLAEGALVEYDARVPGRLGLGFVTGPSTEGNQLANVQGEGGVLQVRFKVLGQPGQVSPLTPHKAQAWQIENTEVTLQPTAGEFRIVGSTFPWMYVLLAAIIAGLAVAAWMWKRTKPTPPDAPTVTP